MVFPRPRPAWKVFKAVAINRHKNDLAAGITGEDPTTEVVQMAFQKVERTSEVKNPDKTTDRAKNKLPTHLQRRSFQAMRCPRSMGLRWM